MKLLDLHPRFFGAGGEGVFDRDGKPAPERTGVGIGFDCPCGCGTECPFENPLDGGPPLRDDVARSLWRRTGDTFENLTLAPSILRIGGCGWHGFVRRGEIVNA